MMMNPYSVHINLTGQQLIFFFLDCFEFEESWEDQYCFPAYKDEEIWGDFTMRNFS